MDVVYTVIGLVVVVQFIIVIRMLNVIDEHIGVLVEQNKLLARKLNETRLEP